MTLRLWSDSQTADHLLSSRDTGFFVVAGKNGTLIKKGRVGGHLSTNPRPCGISISDAFPTRLVLILIRTVFSIEVLAPPSPEAGICFYIFQLRGEGVQGWLVFCRVCDLDLRKKERKRNKKSKTNIIPNSSVTQNENIIPFKNKQTKKSTTSLQENESFQEQPGTQSHFYTCVYMSIK